MPHLDTIAITCKARCFSPTVLTHRTLQRTFHTDHDSVALDFYFYNFDIRQVQRYFYVHHCALRIPYSAFPSLDSTPICRLYPRMLRRAKTSRRGIDPLSILLAIAAIVILSLLILDLTLLPTNKPAAQ